jgi:hypothetical protein
MLRPKAYPLLVAALEEGTAHDVRRAYKHDPSPDQDYLAQCIVDEILGAIDERFDFEELPT